MSKTSRYIFYWIVIISIAGCSGRDENGKAAIDEPEVVAERDTFFLAVEEMPQIIGGIGSIQERLRYPELAKRAGVEGVVYVYAFIDEEGQVVRTEIVNDPGAGLGEAAATAVSLAKFKPGKQRGQPVPVRVSIPIHFRLARQDVAHREKIVEILEGPDDFEVYITYPPEAANNKLEDEVHAEVTLDEHARVIGMRILSDTHYDFAGAVMEAALQYPFSEREEFRGIEGQQTIVIRVRFTLKLLNQSP